MAVRHRIPTIFNIYMVDVLCCALGCVILLWQVNYKEAEKQTAEAKTQTAAAEDRAGKLRTLATEVSQFRSDKDRLDAENRQLAAEKSDLLVKKKLSDEELVKRLREIAQQRIDIEARDRRVDALAKDLDDKTSAFSILDKNLDEQKAKFAEIDRIAKLLGKEKIELLAKIKTSDLRLRVLEDDLARATGETTDSQKKLADLLRDKEFTAKDLEAMKAALAKQTADATETIKRAKAIQIAAENRFAGITLGGKKVVFMVDMSGSMELTDYDTADPDKWPFVCDTIARILSSLTEVTHYQVVLFSDKVSYPLLNEGRWFEVRDKSQDAKVVAESLKRIKPRGPTNMYAAFDEAFKFRALGLDTIYVISDGLPNDGPGLPTNAAKLSEQEITTILSKSLRNKLKTDWNRTIANSPKVRINTIGFFYESPDVGAFLWALAREHDGNFVGMNKRE